MGASAIRIAGADRTVTNQSGSNYADALQVSARRCRLHKLSVSNIGAADVYLWFFDSAAAATAAPVHVRLVPAGLADTYDFGGDGGLFTNGLYVRAGTADPTDATTAITGAGNNAVIIKADYREERI